MTVRVFWILIWWLCVSRLCSNFRVFKRRGFPAHGRLHRANVSLSHNILSNACNGGHEVFCIRNDHFKPLYSRPDSHSNSLRSSEPYPEAEFLQPNFEEETTEFNELDQKWDFSFTSHSSFRIGMGSNQPLCSIEEIGEEAIKPTANKPTNRALFHWSFPVSSSGTSNDEMQKKLLFYASGIETAGQKKNDASSPKNELIASKERQLSSRRKVVSWLRNRIRCAADFDEYKSFLRETLDEEMREQTLFTLQQLVDQLPSHYKEEDTLRSVGALPNKQDEFTGGPIGLLKRREEDRELRSITQKVANAVDNYKKMLLKLPVTPETDAEYDTLQESLVLNEAQSKSLIQRLSLRLRGHKEDMQDTKRDRSWILVPLSLSAAAIPFFSVIKRPTTRIFGILSNAAIALISFRRFRKSRRVSEPRSNALLALCDCLVNAQLKNAGFQKVFVNSAQTVNRTLLIELLFEASTNRNISRLYPAECTELHRFFKALPLTTNDFLDILEGVVVRFIKAYGERGAVSFINGLTHLFKNDSTEMFMKKLTALSQCLCNMLGKESMADAALNHLSNYFRIREPWLRERNMDVTKELYEKLINGAVSSIDRPNDFELDGNNVHEWVLHLGLEQSLAEKIHWDVYRRELDRIGGTESLHPEPCKPHSVSGHANYSTSTKNIFEFMVVRKTLSCLLEKQSLCLENLDFITALLRINRYEAAREASIRNIKKFSTVLSEKMKALAAELANGAKIQEEIYQLIKEFRMVPIGVLSALLDTFSSAVHTLLKTVEDFGKVKNWGETYTGFEKIIAFQKNVEVLIQKIPCGDKNRTHKRLQQCVGQAARLLGISYDKDTLRSALRNYVTEKCEKEAFNPSDIYKLVPYVGLKPGSIDEDVFHVYRTKVKDGADRAVASVSTEKFNSDGILRAKCTFDLGVAQLKLPEKLFEQICKDIYSDEARRVASDNLPTASQMKLLSTLKTVLSIKSINLDSIHTKCFSKFFDWALAESLSVNENAILFPNEKLEKLRKFLRLPRDVCESLKHLNLYRHVEQAIWPRILKAFDELTHSLSQRENDGTNLTEAGARIFEDNMQRSCEELIKFFFKNNMIAISQNGQKQLLLTMPEAGIRAANDVKLSLAFTLKELSAPTIRENILTFYLALLYNKWENQDALQSTLVFGAILGFSQNQVLKKVKDFGRKIHNEMGLSMLQEDQTDIHKIEAALQQTAATFHLDNKQTEEDWFKIRKRFIENMVSKMLGNDLENWSVEKADSLRKLLKSIGLKLANVTEDNVSKKRWLREELKYMKDGITTNNEDFLKALFSELDVSNDFGYLLVEQIMTDEMARLLLSLVESSKCESYQEMVPQMALLLFWRRLSMGVFPHKSFDSGPLGHIEREDIQSLVSLFAAMPAETLARHGFSFSDVNGMFEKTLNDNKENNY